MARIAYLTNGGGLHELQELLGHSTIQTTSMGVPLDKLTSLPRTLRDQAHAQKLAQDTIARRNASESASSSETQHSATGAQHGLAPRLPVKRSKDAAISPLAAKFELLWRVSAPDIALQTEVRLIEGRKFRADYFEPRSHTVIELEGLGALGSNSPIGRHQTIKGFQSDCEKYLEATLSGISVIRLTKKLITPDNIERIAAFIRARK